MAVTTLKRQRRRFILLGVALLILAHVVVGEELATNVCTADSNGNSESGQCKVAAADANSGDDGEDGASKGTENDSDSAMPWYRTLTECKDNHAKCEKWAAGNQCATQPERMLKQCPQACSVCNNHQRDDFSSNCFGEDQSVQGQDYEKTAVRVKETEDYMYQEVFVDPKYNTIRGECKNRHEDCSFWAVIGECEANPAYMTIQCSPACFTCEQLDFTVRCPFDANEPGVWNKKGDLNSMFERIVENKAYTKYNVTVHSQPTLKKKVGAPWVITLDDFLSEQECERLIQLGHDIGYERSEDVGKQNFDGTFEPYKNPGRTSTTAWCVDDCYEDPVSTAVQERIAELTGIPVENSEYLQLLKYKEEEFYHTHHDYIHFHRERAQGVRILTVFLYLNDVDAGGGTNFPSLDLTIEPKRGRVLLWPSVYNDRPDAKDSSTLHQALPVEAGIKYSANGWMHQRDFKGPFKEGCQ